jgi:hypothetical protein
MPSAPAPIHRKPAVPGGGGDVDSGRTAIDLILKSSLRARRIEDRLGSSPIPSLPSLPRAYVPLDVVTHTAGRLDIIKGASAIGSVSDSSDARRNRPKWRGRCGKPEETHQKPRKPTKTPGR